MWFDIYLVNYMASIPQDSNLHFIKYSKANYETRWVNKFMPNITTEHLIQILSILYESMAIEIDKGVKQKKLGGETR
jgi:hypothetical protein